MKYLLDTDHLSILQRQTGAASINLSSRISQYPLSDFVVSIITFHEQLLGSHTYINHARDSEDLLKGYDRMKRLLESFILFPIVLPFDREAAVIFDNLRNQRIAGSTMDLRIAAIALSRNLVLLTRNQRDFEKVPGLVSQDWTVAV
jgi:tRNA(fMet)-specific endonuclease VapC